MNTKTKEGEKFVAKQHHKEQGENDSESFFYMTRVSKHFFR